MHRIVYIWLLIMLTVSCSEWLDVNDDPNRLEDVEMENIISSGISSIAYVMGGKYQILGALWSQHWTQSPAASQYSGIDSYDINSSSFDDRQYGELYAGALKSLETVKSKALEQEEWNYYLVSVTLQCYTYQILADLYGQIPFSEALRGDKNLTPKFEKGDDIYDSLIVRLDNALSKDFDKEDLKELAENDFLFQGDMDHWIEFANTLKLKIFLRQSEVHPDLAQAGIKKMYDDEVDFLSIDAAMTQFDNVSGGRNPLYDTEIIFSGGNPNLILSKTLHSYLEQVGDYDRLNAMFNTPANGGGHKSLPQGDYYAPGEELGITSASYSKPVFLPNATVYMMSLTESMLLQAEAIIRYGTDEYKIAKEKYNVGLSATYYRLLLPTGYILEENMFDPDGTEPIEEYKFPEEGSQEDDFVEKISMQKWVSLAGIQSLECFFEHNRTNFPKETVGVSSKDDDYEPGQFTISVNNVTSNRYPRRLIFPESENISNPNTPPKKAVWEPIWWDVVR